MTYTSFTREGRKLAIGMGFMLLFFGPIVIGGLVGALLWGELGMFLGALTPPMTAFVLFMAWCIGDDFR